MKTLLCLLSFCLSLAAWAGREARFSYRDAESASWEEVRVGAMPFGRSPLSVHVPVGLPGAADLLFCDCAFNAWKLPVPPDAKAGDPKEEDALRWAGEGQPQTIQRSDTVAAVFDG